MQESIKFAFFSPAKNLQKNNLEIKSKTKMINFSTYSLRCLLVQELVNCLFVEHASPTESVHSIAQVVVPWFWLAGLLGRFIPRSRLCSNSFCRCQLGSCRFRSGRLYRCLSVSHLKIPPPSIRATITNHRNSTPTHKNSNVSKQIPKNSTFIEQNYPRYTPVRELLFCRLLPPDSIAQFFPNPPTRLINAEVNNSH